MAFHVRGSTCTIETIQNMKEWNWTTSTKRICSRNNNVSILLPFPLCAAMITTTVPYSYCTHLFPCVFKWSKCCTFVVESAKMKMVVCTTQNAARVQTIPLIFLTEQDCWKQCGWCGHGCTTFPNIPTASVLACMAGASVNWMDEYFVWLAGVFFKTNACTAVVWRGLDHRY